MSRANTTISFEDCGKAEMETIELADDYCPKDCYYRLRFDTTTFCCGYCIIEGHPRGCKISECDKYRQGHKRVVIDKADMTYRWIEDDGI